MKKLVSVILSVSILAGTCHWDEIAKLPALIGHYSKHLKSESNLTFAGFLIQHYLDRSFDPKDHNRLPFKSKKIISHISIYSLEAKSNFIPRLIYPIIKFPETSFKLRSGLTYIFPPPKIG